MPDCITPNERSSRNGHQLQKPHAVNELSPTRSLEYAPFVTSCKQHDVVTLLGSNLHVLLGVPRPLKHVQHALRDGEPAPNVDC